MPSQMIPVRRRPSQEPELFHVRTAGDPDAPLLLMLHGFPEHSGAWAEMTDRLSDSFFCVAPDQRGYGPSPRPHDVAAYQVHHLTADALGVLDHFRPGGRAAAVIGHDWGASVSYALAIKAPERIGKLVIANGVHPIPFQRALIQGGAQTEASQYMHWLRAEGSEDKLAADDFSGVMRMLWKRMNTDWMTPEKLAGYKAAWGQPGAMRGMVNWYRATPIVVPKSGERLPTAPLLELDPETLRIRMPHLLIWGMDDEALLPEARAGLEDFCDDLRVVEIEGADHWILHQTPDEVAALIRDFLG